MYQVFAFLIQDGACDHNQDIEDFLDSMKQCFDDVDKALVEQSASIPLEYVASRLAGTALGEGLRGL